MAAKGERVEGNRPVFWLGFFRLLGSGAAGAAPDVLLEASETRALGSRRRAGAGAYGALRGVAAKAYASQYALSLAV